jgi:release factor glutamine methyltransferase
VGEVERATARLAAAGYPEPRRTALRLWTEVVEASGSLEPVSTDPHNGEASRHAVYRDAVGRLLAGEPLAYVCGTVGFRRLVLAVDSRVLIPRPETEGLVDLALALVPRGRALDLGTGSGCLALALADEGCYADVTATELSPGALEVARQNGQRLGLAVRWRQGCWLEPVRGERFDVIVTNPPYIAREELANLDPSVRDWEPWLALDGGPGGLEASRTILQDAWEALAPGGWLCMEVDARRAAATAELARACGWTAVRIDDDLFGRARYLTARRS